MLINQFKTTVIERNNTAFFLTKLSNYFLLMIFISLPAYSTALPNAQYKQNSIVKEFTVSNTPATSFPFYKTSDWFVIMGTPLDLDQAMKKIQELEARGFPVNIYAPSEQLGLNNFSIVIGANIPDYKSAKRLFMRAINYGYLDSYLMEVSKYSEIIIYIDMESDEPVTHDVLKVLGKQGIFQYPFMPLIESYAKNIIKNQLNKTTEDIYVNASLIYNLGADPASIMQLIEIFNRQFQFDRTDESIAAIYSYGDLINEIFIKNFVRRIIKQNIHDDYYSRLSNDLYFIENLGADNYDVSEMIKACENFFGISISAADANYFTTVGVAINMVIQKYYNSGWRVDVD